MKPPVRFVFPAMPFLFIVLALEFAVRKSWIPEYLIPAPSLVVETLVEEKTTLLKAFSETLLGAIAGLALSTIGGILGGVVLMRFQMLRQAIVPYAVFFQTVPIVAIAPLLVIWFGFGLQTVVISSWIVSFFPVLAGTIAGLSSVDLQALDLFRLYNASQWKTILLLRLPWAVPQIFTGLRVAGGLAVIGAVVGEFVAGGGLGALIDAARTQQRVDMVFAAVLLSTVIGLIIVYGIDFLRERWRYGRRDVS